MPIVAGESVPWIARRLPPVQPGGVLGWCAAQRQHAAAVVGAVARAGELVGDREAPGRRLRAGPPDSDFQPVHDPAVAAQRDACAPTGPRAATSACARSSPQRRAGPTRARRWAWRSRPRRARRRAERPRPAPAATRTRWSCPECPRAGPPGRALKVTFLCTTASRNGRGPAGFVRLDDRSRRLEIRPVQAACSGGGEPSAVWATKKAVRAVATSSREGRTRILHCVDHPHGSRQPPGAALDVRTRAAPGAT